jgi:hypothetical protein
VRRRFDFMYGLTSRICLESFCCELRCAKRQVFLKLLQGTPWTKSSIARVTA